MLLSRLRPERFVLLFGLLFGLTLCLVTPPFMVADEPAHFLRAYEVSMGHALSTVSTTPPTKGRAGRELPASLKVAEDNLIHGMVFHPEIKVDWDRLDAAMQQPLNPGQTQFLTFINTALYSPVPYLPQAAGIWLGRALVLPPIYILYLGRLTNLVVVMLLLALAVRLMPMQKWAMAAVILLPMSLYQCASLSADGTTLAFAFLFFALVLRLTLVPEQKPTRPYLFSLSLLSICLCLAKTAYFPLLALLLIVPAAKFATGWRGKIGMLLLVGVAGLVALGLWMWLIGDLYSSPLPRVEPHKQLEYLKSNPSEVLGILARTWQQHAERLGVGMLGRELSWGDVKIGLFYLRPIAEVFFLFVLFDASNQLAASPSAWSRILSAVIWLGTAIVLALLMYLSWTEIGAPVVVGLSARYFLPVLPLLALVVANRKLGSFQIVRRFTPVLAVLYAVYGGAVMLTFVIKRFYFT